MQLLAELLEIKERADSFDEETMALFESLGSLNLIKKKFVNMLRKSNMFWNTGREKKSGLRDEVGQNSKIDVHVENNPNQLWERFNDNDKVVALIIQFDGEQVLAVAKTGKDRKGTPEYAILIDPAFFKATGITADEFEDGIGNVGREYTSGDFRIERLTAGIKSGSVTGKLRKFIKLVVQKSKASGVEVKSMLIMKDEERAKLAAERDAAKSGAIAPKGAKTQDSRGRGDRKAFENINSAWNKAMKGDLRTRLERYKTNKADDVATVQDMLAKVMSDGFLDKIKVGGIPYKIGNERIYMRELKSKLAGKPDRWGVPSIEYDYDSSGGNVAKEMFKKFREEADKRGLNYGDKEFNELKMKMLPARKLVVTLKLDGGKIVPDTIEADLDAAYDW